MRLEYETPPEQERQPPSRRTPMFWTAMSVFWVAMLLLHWFSHLGRNADRMSLLAGAMTATAAGTNILVAIRHWVRYRQSVDRFYGR
jgi:membrane protein YqaA with SNARE-associated domain